MSTAFYASFLPSRASNRVSAVSDPSEGLTFSGAIVAQSHPSALNYTTDNQSTRGISALAAPAAGLVSQIVASNPLTLESNASTDSTTIITTNDGDVRVSAASATTPQNPNVNPAAVGTGTPPASPTQPRPGTTPTPSATPSPSATAKGQNPNVIAATLTPTATATKTPVDTTPPCDNSQSDIFCVYTVGSGDTLSGIAAKFGVKGNDDVSAAEILANSNKPDINDEDDLLQIGLKLRIPKNGAALAPAASPSKSGTPPAGSTPSSSSSSTTQVKAGSVIHTVLSAETLLDIANKYGVDVSDIMAANPKLSSPDKLSIGQELLIPNPKRFAPAAVAVPSPTASDASSSSSSSSSGTAKSSGSGSGSSSGSSAPASISGPRSASGFIWPTSGPISSYFGPSHPLGIDIDLFSNPNAPIGAAAAGTVTFAGGNACCSYGLYVVVDHANGLQTLYAHMSSLKVTTGQQVTQGQILGIGGRTGNATGNHLHFEVHVNGSVVNPLGYLP